MTLYLAIFLFGAGAGAWADRWWSNYLDDSDTRTIEQRRREQQAWSNLRRWE